MRQLAAFAASAAFAWLFTVSACTAIPTKPGKSSTGRDFARPEPTAPVSNFAWITPGVARGGQPDAAGMRFLRERGFRTVVNFRSYHSDRDLAKDVGLESIEIPVQADVFGSEPPTEEQLKTFFAAVLDPAKQPVFFHCAHGKDRTGTLAAVYRMEVDGWTSDEAIEEMNFFGYHAIYQDLIGFVKDYKPRGFARPR